MDISNQIKLNRQKLSLSQEALAEKLYVSRQTISNWENEKSYPDIHSLLLLSNLFNVSVDELIKGDIDMMKEKINTNDVNRYNRLAGIFTVLFILSVILPAPLVIKLGLAAGLAVYIPLYIVTMIFAIKIEKIKKNNNVQTFKEIVAFSKGETLDEITKQSEQKKIRSQAVIAILASGGLTFLIGLALLLILL